MGTTRYPYLGVSISGSGRNWNVRDTEGKIIKRCTSKREALDVIDMIEKVHQTEATNKERPKNE